MSSLTRPMSLDEKTIDNLRILYLAKFAPKEDQIQPTKDSSYPALSKYHFDLYSELKKIGLSVTPTSNIQDAITEIKRYNYIFSIENSAAFRNSEVLISSVAECYKVPYLGAPPNVRALAEDKYLSSIFAHQIGIKTPKSSFFPRENPINFEPPFKGPFIIKPRFGVNSEYLLENCVQDSWSEIVNLMDYFFDLKMEFVVEEFIPGDNYSAPFIEAVDPMLMPVIQDPMVGGFNVLTSFHKQYSGLKKRNICYDEKITQQLRTGNYFIRKDIGQVDYFRTDWRIHERSKLAYLLEINICCSLAPWSGIAIACKELGWEYSDILETIISNSVRTKPSSR